MGSNSKATNRLAEDRSTGAPGRSIVLVGMMGVGKTTIGKRLAQRLGMPFVDADHAIEEAAGMTVAEIFARYGEPAFRDGEKRVIGRLIEGPPCVIATGGGAFATEETRNLILEKARSVWLDAPIDTLVRRVSRRSSRPLLVGRDPRSVLTELAKARNGWYAMADIHVQSDDCPHEMTVDRIVQALKL